jgi:RNA polymerase sigma factor (TIGR02999 family)
MTQITRILSAIEQGDSHAAQQLLPVVYDELRQLAAQKLDQEKPGQTFEPTVLVHEAYLRLVGDQRFTGRGHFFAAAAEAMRRILIENARRKGRHKHGGGRLRQELPSELLDEHRREDDLPAIDAALAKLAQRDPLKARLVELRVFAGMTGEQATLDLGISPNTADRHWVFARV